MACSASARGRTIAGSSQLQQGSAQQFALLEAGFVPAAVGIADQAGGVGDQDEALGVAENLAGEVALALQFRLIGVKAGDIEHQAANLQQTPKIVVHAESVDEHVDGRAVLAAKRGLKVAHVAIFFHGLGVAVALLGRKIDLGRNIDLQKFFAAGIAEHRHQGVVDFDEAALRGAEE